VPARVPADMSDPLVVNESDADPVTWSDPVRGDVCFRTLFGGPATRTDFTAGVTSLDAGGWLGHHRHEPSEIYYVLGGVGLLTIDGEEHVVDAGTAVFVPSNSEHGIRNTGREPLRFFYVFAVGAFEAIEYDFTASHQSSPSA
jgi:mannose-6-phosphate isomerase-like protein (cupin superfamily)